MIRFPKALSRGDLIAVTAPSSGVTAAALPRLDLVLSNLRAQGYRIVEGECLRGERKDASAPREQRAHELLRFLNDPEVAAILPPWGGELAIELLPLIDFEKLRSVPPKWLLGYSDISTLQLPLTLISRWATAHGPNLMDLAPSQTDPLTTSALKVLSSDFSSPVVQCASSRYQKKYIDFEVDPDAALNLTELTTWKRLDGLEAPAEFRGRLIGGCLDTISHLAGSSYGDIPRFVRESGTVGTILYLENAGMPPTALVRALCGLRMNGWFQGLSGLMFGRSNGPQAQRAEDLTYEEALQAVLTDAPYPILYDVDIGHQPPQFALVNGATAQVHFEAGRGRVTQMRGETCSPEARARTR
jgi:muramoyltetrapeptide carboxypeptidase LdcA involved in peptidoglycan recycling